MEYVDFDLFEDEQVLVIEPKDFNPDLKNSQEFVEFIMACRLRGITFGEFEYLEIAHLEPKSLRALTSQILPKQGLVFHNKFKKSLSYDFKDSLDQITHYLLRYGLEADDNNYDLKLELDLSQIPKNPVTFELKYFDYVTDKQERIALNLNNPSAKDYRIMQIDTGFVPFKINNKKLLQHMLLNVWGDDKVKYFVSFSECNTLRDMRNLVLNVLKRTKYIRYDTKAEKNNFRIPGSMKRWLKTWVIEKIDENYFPFNKEENVEINQNKAFYFELARIINPKDRYKTYANAQRFFDELHRNSFKLNSLSIINKLSNEGNSNFNTLFNIYEAYNPNYAFKNLLNIFKHSTSESVDIEKTLTDSKANLKSRFEAFLGILKFIENDRRISKHNKYFYNYDKKEFSKNPKELIVALKNSITNKFSKEFNKFLGYQYIKIPKRVLLDTKTLKETAFPLFNYNDLYGKVWRPRGSVIDLSNTKKLRAFVAWKRKSNTAGSLDLDLEMLGFTPGNSTLNISWRHKQELGIGLNHSGDFTSCRSFDPSNPIITAEFIDVDFEKLGDYLYDMAFHVVSYTSEPLEYYDVYFGIIENPKDTETNFINLNDASYSFKIDLEDGINTLLFSINNLKRELTIINEEFNYKSRHDIRNILDYYEFGIDFYSAFKFWYLNIINDLNSDEIPNDSETLIITNSNHELKDKLKDSETKILDLSQYQELIKRFLNA